MLTGKDVYEAFRQYDKDASSQIDASAYGVVADMLNASHITPLQGVVRGFVALLEDDDLMIEDSPDGWYDRKRKAYDTAQQLLKEDIPC